MNPPSIARHLASFLLPFVVALVVPFLLLARFDPLRVPMRTPLPALQLPLGALLVLFGLFLLVLTIRMLATIGRGTLAPWDATERLVVEGIYAHTRNPMISGVAIIVFGESVLFGSLWILSWFAAIVIVNTIYFKLSEERGLVKRFGNEYLAYRRNVPMWIPRLRAWTPHGGDAREKP